jgi:hypothetical protein
MLASKTMSWGYVILLVLSPAILYSIALVVSELDTKSQFLSAHLLAVISALIGYSAATCTIASIDGYYRFADVLSKAFSPNHWFLPYGLALASLLLVRAFLRQWYRDRAAVGVLSAAFICFTATLLLMYFLRIAA